MKHRKDVIPGRGPLSVTQTIQRLVQLCDETDRAEEAAEWKTTLAELEKTQPEKETVAPKP